MTADFADSLRTERHFEGPDELEMTERAIARTHIALARPADLMRQPHAEEAEETAQQIAGIARLHGWSIVEDTEYDVCECRTGKHLPASVVLTSTDVTIARSEKAYTPGGHLVPYTRLSLRSPAGGEVL